MKRTALLALVIFLASVVLAAAPLMAADPCTDPVSAGSGLVAGQADSESDTCSWLGIPFAAPPVGELRWKAPRPAPAWDGVRETVAFGPQCMQHGSGGLMDDKSVATSEDCLYLNIWRPKKSGVFPVMFWIHGGGYANGTAASPMYWGDRMAAAGDVVVVSINYRLNIFGFMATPELRAEDENGSAGSYGSLDQAAALQWVHDNIEGFGGDPTNVTVFGESAGGWSVCTMLATPLNRGNIHKAILESGGCEASASLEKGYEQAKAAAAVLGCGADDLACLRAVPAEKLLEATGGLLDGFVWVPHHDGYLLTGTPLSMIRDGNYNRVPFIAGSNQKEVDALIGLLPDVRFATAKKYEPVLQKYFGANEPEAARLAELYPLDQFGGRPKKAIGRLATDGGLGCPTYTGMLAASQNQPETWYYRFDYHDFAAGGAIGAVHAMEIPYVFNSFDRKPISLLYNGPKTKRAKPLSDLIQGYWINFAKTGNPNGEGLPEWPAFSPAAQNMMVFDRESGVQQADMEERCEFWEEFNQKHGALPETFGSMVDNLIGG